MAAERLLVARMLDAGGLRVVGADARGRTIETGTPAGGPVRVVRPATAGAALQGELVGVALASGPVLAPETPAVVRDHLAALSVGDLRITLFDEASAVRLAFLTTIRDGAAWSVDDLRIALVGARAVDALGRGRGVPAALVAELKKSGALPGFAGKGVSWGEARRAERDPPEIPGVSSPPVVHQAFAPFGFIRRGGLRLTGFRLDERLARLVFAKVILAGRQRFFDWLSMGAHTLRPSTLRAISAMPVWPGVDGTHRPLADYCVPRTQFLRDVLAAASTRPAPAVVALARSKRLPARSLSLRHQPGIAEILEWHRAALDGLPPPDVTGFARDLDRVEATLERLAACDPSWAAPLGAQHRTLSQAGAMAPVAALHVPSAATLACGLSPDVLAGARRGHLYLALGARPRPTVAALLAALRTDPDPVRLFPRLEAYRAAGGDLTGLGAEPIVPVAGGAQAGATLAFAGEPDFWGAWKTRIDADDVAEHRSLLGHLGVIRPRPSRDLSLGFHRWLGQQGARVQREHHQQVDLHWRERAVGPLSWTDGDADVPCVPVTGASQPFGLVSLSAARDPRQAVFLDDFPEIAKEVLEGGRARLTLVRAPGAQRSILDVLAAARIPSLRAAVGSPRRIDGSGDAHPLADLSITLTQLQSRAGRANLRVKLPLHGGDTADLRGDWQKLLKDLKGVRTRPTLLAEYRLLGRTHVVPVKAGVDRQTGLVWIAGDADRLHEFYEVLAAHLFRPGREDVWALLRAARDGRQLSMFEQGGGQPDDDDGTEGEDEETQDDGGPGDDDDDGIDKGHGLNGGLTKPVVPDPKPIQPIHGHTPLPKRASRRSRASSRSDAGRSVEEEEQKRVLKAEHYGYHCQACLGAMEVLKAAPPGTYVYSPGYRSRLLHAHHAQHRQNQGALGAGNLLILCEYHHRSWGDRLARGPVLAALAVARPIGRRFPVDDAGRTLTSRQGLLAVVTIDVEPFEARLYFTSEHADAWRSEGDRPEAGDGG